MKKLLLLTMCVFAFTIQSQAQNIADNAIGLRIGGGSGFGTEISYQRALGGNNRMELDLGWSNRSDIDAFRLTGLYQYVWNIEGGFNWYAGAGAGVGAAEVNGDNDVFLSAAGNVGIEYDFDFPLLLSLGFRPEIGLINYYGDDLDFDLALGIRYQF